MKLLILGTGQYASVAKDVALTMHKYDEIECLDISRDSGIANGDMSGIEARIGDCSKEEVEVMVAIGNNDVRKYIEASLLKAGVQVAEYPEKCQLIKQRISQEEEYCFEIGV